MLPILSLWALALFAAAVGAAPFFAGAPSRVASGGYPAPSLYPLGDAGCQNEWKYLNFNPLDAIDNTRLRKLHNIICSGEIRAITISGATSATAGDHVYKRYFPLSDNQTNFQGHVNSVLTKIAGQNINEGDVGDVVGTFVVDNLDFATACTPKDDNYSMPTLAYTGTDGFDKLEKIHFCDNAWSRPNLNKRSKQCGGFDPFPSTKMDSFSRVALRQMMHYSSVGPNSTLGQPIQDVVNADLQDANEPSRTFGLLDEDQDNSPALTEYNADSYAWMTIESWLSVCCSNNDTASDEFFTQDPPPYGP